MESKKLASYLLRIGIAFVFIYAAAGSLKDPTAWIGFFPLFIRGTIPHNFLLFGFSGYEFFLGIWLLSGYWIDYAAIFSAATLLGVIFSNIGALDIIFRDVAIFFAALALIVMQYGEKFSRKSA